MCRSHFAAYTIPAIFGKVPAGHVLRQTSSLSPSLQPQCLFHLPNLHDSVCSLSLQGTILPGVTRKSVLELARDLGFTAEEAPITIEEAMQADEVFTTGTAVVLSPVGSLTYKGTKKVFGKPGAGGEQLVWARGRLLGLWPEQQGCIAGRLSQSLLVTCCHSLSALQRSFWKQQCKKTLQPCTLD